MKKLVSIFLALALIIFQINVMKVHADTIYQSGNYTYSVSNSTAVITGYTGSGGNITIPSKINGYTVTSIGDSAFYFRSNLTSVTIPNSVTNIGNSAFLLCTSLTNITIPNSVISIGDSAFNYCTGLTSVTIPNSVKNIGDFAFNGCTGLKSITIPNSVTSIGSAAFAYSGLTNVTIPSSITSIGGCAFSSCTRLTAINVDANNTSYSSFDGVLYNKAITTLINYPAGTTNSTFVVPSSVISIDGGSFEGCTSLINIKIPNSVTSIGGGSFEGCSSLTSITVPNSVISIGDKAFFGCSKLTSATIPNSVTSIDDSAFFNCPSNLIIYYHNSTIGFTNPWKGYKTVSGNMVSYDGNENTGGTVQADNNIYPKGTKAAVLRNDGSLVKTGYVFAGWNTEKDGSGISYSANALIPMNSIDITLYAQWKASYKYTVSFNSNGGSNVSSVTNITAGTNITLPTAPTKAGYTFAGWNTAQDGSGAAFTVATLVNEDEIVYAQWAAISPSKGTFITAEPSNLTATITAPNKLTNPIIGVYSGETKLQLGTDEFLTDTNTGYMLTLDKSYLSKLTGNTTITIKFEDGSSINYNIILSTASISPVTGTFTTAVPTNLITVITAPNKLTNPVIGVYNGDTKLIGGTDEAVAPTNTGYTLTLDKSYLSKLTGNTTIIIKFKDGSSINYNVILSTASISPVTGTFTPSAPTNLITDITAPNKFTNPIIGVYSGETKLVGGTDESITSTDTGYTLTLDKSYLSKLIGNTTITIKFKDGSSINYNVILSTTSITPAIGTFTPTAPANLKTVITAVNKAVNPVVGVYNGDTKLIGGTDEAVTPTTTGYTLTLYKSYLSKLTSNTVITIKFKDGYSINYNVILSAEGITPTIGTFITAAPANLTAIITVSNKFTNPITGVYNGDTKLQSGTDEFLIDATTGYTLILNKSYLSKLTSNTVITIKFKDGSSINYTINLK